MHEWGIAKNSIEKIADAVRKNNLTKAVRVEINLGAGLGIGKEEFVHCLKTVTEGDAMFAACDFAVTLVESNLASIESIDAE